MSANTNRPDRGSSQRQIMRVPNMDGYENSATHYADGRPRRYRRTEVAHPANEDLGDLVVSSKLGNGMHSPVLDLDYQATLIPSTTPGHNHLYLDGVQLSWWRYRVLLRCLAWAGVIETAYYRHSVHRRGTAVRLPSVHKVRGR